MSKNYLIIICLFLLGCSKPDTYLIGTWEFVKFNSTTYENGILSYDTDVKPDRYSYYVFNKDGTGYVDVALVGDTSIGSFTYTMTKEGIVFDGGNPFYFIERKRKEIVMAFDNNYTIGNYTFDNTQSIYLELR